MPNINKNIIKQAGAAVANATNKAAGLSAATPEPGSIISAIQLVNGGRTVGPGDPVHFVESVRNKLKTLVVDMLPIQDFNGYDHPWPAGGGENVLDPNIKFTAGTYHGVNLATDTGYEYTLTDTATEGGTIVTNIIALADAVLLPPGTYYGSAGSYELRDANGTFLKNQYGGTAFTRNESFYVRRAYIEIVNGREYNASFFIGLKKGSSGLTAWTPYANICPITGRTGVNAHVSPTPNVADATTYSADWTTPAGTVYAGSADIVTGDIKAAPYYASYNGETLVGPWVSSMDVYDPEGTPTTGAQVVDRGGAMTEYHFTGQDVITLVGDNYIWSDSGDVTITE